VFYNYLKTTCIADICTAGIGLDSHACTRQRGYIYKVIKTATIWAIVIALSVALAACNHAEEPVNNSSVAEKTIYTDYHMHIQSKPMADVLIAITGSDTFSENQLEEFSAVTIIALLDEAGLDRAFILSEAYILGNDLIAGLDEYNDVKKENNYFAIQCARYPERLIGFFGVNPLKEYAVEEVDRCYDELKLPGLKLQFANSNVDLTNPEHLAKIQELFAHCAEKGIPILLHFRNDNPEFGKKDAEILINEVIAKTPGLKLQMVHLGGYRGFDKATEEVISTFIEEYEKNKNLDKSNIVFDISGVVVTENEEIKGMLDSTTEEQHKRIADYIRTW